MGPRKIGNRKPHAAERVVFPFREKSNPCSRFPTLAL
nr:MAG TPA: hypothetical protein [Caudoviricetes sp.]